MCGQSPGSLNLTLLMLGEPECQGDRDFLASIPADIMLKLKQCSRLPGLIPVLGLDRQPLGPHLETDTLRVGS